MNTLYNELLNGLYSLPPKVQTGVIAGFAAIIGAILLGLLAALFRIQVSSRTMTIGVAIVVIAAIHLAEEPLASARQQRSIDQIVFEGRKHYRVVDLLLREHPEEEMALKRAIAAAAPGSVRKVIEATTSDLITKYLPTYIPRASTAALHSIIRVELEVLQSLRASPDQCAAYSAGFDKRSAPLIPQALTEQIDHSMADIVQTAIETPNLTPAPPLSEVAVPLAKEYSLKGYDIHELGKLANTERDDVASQSATCLRFLHLMDALTSMDETQGAAFFRLAFPPLKQ